MKMPTPPGYISTDNAFDELFNDAYNDACNGLFDEADDPSGAVRDAINKQALRAIVVTRTPANGWHEDYLPDELWNTEVGISSLRNGMLLRLNGLPEHLFRWAGFPLYFRSIKWESWRKGRSWGREPQTAWLTWDDAIVQLRGVPITASEATSMLHQHIAAGVARARGISNSHGSEPDAALYYALTPALLEQGEFLAQVPAVRFDGITISALEIDRKAVSELIAKCSPPAPIDAAHSGKLGEQSSSLPSEQTIADDAHITAWLTVDMAQRTLAKEPKNRPTMVFAMRERFPGLGERHARKLFTALPKEFKGRGGRRPGTRNPGQK
jgi:hypothetical protein